MHRSTAQLFIVVLSLLAGCAPAPRGLRWEMLIESTALRDRVAAVEGRILTGGCGSGTVAYSSEAARDGTPTMPPTLSPGTYGFEGIARDEDCVAFARGCVELVLPASTELITVRLVASMEEPACAAASCTAGLCDGPGDAGSDASMDAGRDAGALDASRDASSDAPSDTPRDVGVDAPRDAGRDAPMDAGPPIPIPTGDRIAIDFGPTVTTTGGWIVHGALDGTTSRVATVAGVPTSVSVTTRDFTGEQPGGSMVNTLGYPPTASSDTLWVGTFDGHTPALAFDGIVELTGVAAGTYGIELFASRDGDDEGNGRLTRYGIGAVEQDLDATDNTSRIVTFTGVSPDASGTITLHVTVSPAGTSRFGYIGTLILSPET